MVMIQIRNVPPDLHALLTDRAKARGMNLSDFLKEQLERIAAVPTNAEIFARVEADAQAGLLPEVGSEEIVSWIREDRDFH
jgi:hypothetical protein